MPPRFFHAPLPDAVDAADTVLLDLEQTRHARRVLRLTPDDPLELFDGTGRLASAAVVDAAEGAGPRLACRIQAVTHVPRLGPMLWLATAAPKGGRLEDLVNKIVQLGCDRWTPLLTERGVVAPRGGKLERAGRVALEAMKQSRRLHAMQVDRPLTLDALLEAVPEPVDLRVLDPAGEAVAPAAEKPGLPRVALVGPEGGWAPGELDRLDRAGALRWRINPHVLRIETAAVAAAALLRAPVDGAA